MIEQALRRFCESKHRKLIVTAGTFIVGLLLVMPLVDAYSAGRDEKEGLLTELESARSMAGELDKFEKRVAEKLAQLQVSEAHSVNDESMPKLRGQLMDLAKETQCSIRKLNVGGTTSRPWQLGANPIDPTADKKVADANSPYKLESRPISISLSGTRAALQSTVERLAASKMMMHIKSLELYPSSPNRQTLTMDMEIWYFTLARKGAVN
jgi:hypothetical protein